MISSKTTFTLLFLCLFLHLNVRAQRHSVKEIDDMLISARESMVTNPGKTVKLSNKIYKLSVANDYQKGQDYGLLLLNHGYMNLYKYDYAIKNQVKLEETAQKHLNYEVLANAKLLNARTLSRIQHYQKSLEEVKKARRIVRKIESQNSKAIYNGLVYQTIGYINQHQLESRDSVFRYYLMAKNEFEKVQDVKNDGFEMYTKDDLLYNSYAFLANEFMAQKNGFDSVDIYLDKALKLHPRYENSVSTVLIHNNIAWRFLENKNFKEALKNYEISVEVSKKYNHKECLIAAYDGLSDVYEEMKDYQNASKYGNLMKYLQEDFAKSNKTVISKSVENLLTETGSSLEKKNENLSRIVIIIAVLTFFCFYTAFLFYQKFKNEKLTNKEIESLLKEKMDQLSDSSKENEVISKEIDIEEIITLAMNNEAHFYVKFQEAFPDFKEKLAEIAPSIVASELKFAAYLKLDFSAKEIARYTNSSVRAVEAKKYRLRKKLNIPSESDINVWVSKV